MLCVFLFNCHGSQIMFQLSQCSEFINKYECIHIDLNDYVPYGQMIKNKLGDRDLKLIQNADLLIVQYMRTDRDYLNYENIVKILKKNCVVLKLPHYSSSIYWFKNENSILVDDDDIVSLVITFIQNELLHIKKLDELSDIKIHDFVANNYKEQQLYHGRYYPTYFIFHYIAQQILYKVDINIKIEPHPNKYVVKSNRLEDITLINKKLLELKF
jgi:hypothetical protein